MKGLTKIFLGTAVFLLSVSQAYAASDGTVGLTSTGSSTLSLTIPEFVVISGMADFGFGSWNGTSALDLDDDVIISGNDDQASPTYKVNIVGNGAAGAFTMARSAPAAPGATIAYTVEFNDATGTGGVSVTKGVDVTAQSGINGTLDSTNENANIRVQISLAALQAAPYGTYGGTLTIVVTPE